MHSLLKNHTHTFNTTVQYCDNTIINSHISTHTAIPALIKYL